ncbi:MAG: hypothetical protein ABIE74_05985 [Pseudomonadota bacterium]
MCDKSTLVGGARAIKERKKMLPTKETNHNKNRFPIHQSSKIRLSAGKLKLSPMGKERHTNLNPKGLPWVSQPVKLAANRKTGKTTVRKKSAKQGFKSPILWDGFSVAFSMKVLITEEHSNDLKKLLSAEKYSRDMKLDRFSKPEKGKISENPLLVGIRFSTGVKTSDNHHAFSLSYSYFPSKRSLHFGNFSFEGLEMKRTGHQWGIGYSYRFFHNIPITVEKPDDKLYLSFGATSALSFGMSSYDFTTAFPSNKEYIDQDNIWYMGGFIGAELSIGHPSFKFFVRPGFSLGFTLNNSPNFYIKSGTPSVAFVLLMGMRFLEYNRAFFPWNLFNKKTQIKTTPTITSSKKKKSKRSWKRRKKRYYNYFEKIPSTFYTGIVYGPDRQQTTVTIKRDIRITRQRIIFKAGTKLTFRKGVLVTAILSKDHIINGIPCKKGGEVQFHTNGNIKSTTLSKNHIFFIRDKEMSGKAGTKAEFNSDGSVKSFTLSKKHTVHGISFEARTKIRFDQQKTLDFETLEVYTINSYKLSSAILSKEHTIQKILCKAGREVRFDKEGKLCSYEIVPKELSQNNLRFFDNLI